MYTVKTRQYLILQSVFYRFKRSLKQLYENINYQLCKRDIRKYGNHALRTITTFKLCIGIQHVSRQKLKCQQFEEKCDLKLFVLPTTSGKKSRFCSL